MASESYWCLFSPLSLKSVNQSRSVCSTESQPEPLRSASIFGSVCRNMQNEELGFFPSSNACLNK